MKLRYDELPDADDLLLKDAVERHIVPPGCRMSGAVVLGLHEDGLDPCGSCKYDRDICGGRPGKPDPAPPRAGSLEEIEHQLSNDSASARALRRKLTIGMLNKLVAEGGED